MTIEELRDKHRRRLVVAAFRGRFFREPTREELSVWVNYLATGRSVQDLIADMLESPRPKELATVSRLDSAGSRQRMLAECLGNLYCYVDHTIACPVNSGVQRVTRQLARALLEEGRRVIFVKWSVSLNRLVLVNQAELDHLAQWGGPRLSSNQIFADGYPATNDDLPRPIDGVNIHDRNWLIVSEVPHINFHGRQLTLELILAAKRACLRTAFVFYDAIPLRRPEHSGMAPFHEAYMRQLLQADLLFPISGWASSDLHGFFSHHELVADDFMPAIEALLLPAEMHGVARVTACGSGESAGVRSILSVGSIDVRKNQLPLVRAFVKLVEVGLADEWSLVLVGNCNPDLHPELSAIMAACPAVVWKRDCSDADLKSAYSECSFTVFPSVEEGYGLPIAESLWHGKPCLCANFGPMAEIASAGGCLTVDMRNPVAVTMGLLSLMHDRALHAGISNQATQRHLDTWGDYAQNFTGHLTSKSNPISGLRLVYYLVGDTALYPHNSGIQRVVRALATALLNQNVQLIAAKWNADKTNLIQPSAAELAHLAKWNGPQANGWAPWCEPVGTCLGDWVVFPELTSSYQPCEYVAIRKFLDERLMRGCWVFYDTIPWKLREIYSKAATQGHRHYMAGLNLFELTLAISDYSRDQLELYYLEEAQATTDLTHRLVACPLPGEFLETLRVLVPKPSHEQPIHILSVGTLEPRKNHITLIRAFLSAAANSPRAMRLTLAGGGHPEITAQVNSLIEQHASIRWIRSPTDTELNLLYSDCDFTVYPSYEEGFGLPILESLWHARSCICMNRGAMAEVALGGGCLLVDTTNEAALSAAIYSMVNDESQRRRLCDEAVRRPFRTWDDYGSDFALRMAEERRVAASVAMRLQVSEIANSNEIYGAMPNIKRRPILSVCISTYNRAKWLALSLDVLVREARGLADEVEVFVCDNTSTDTTPDVVAPFVDRAEVRYLRNPENVGMLGNLRVTAQEARGQYIWVLGDDDLVKPGSVQRVLDIVKANPDLAMVYLNYAYTRDDSPAAIADLGQFFASAIPVADGGKSGRFLVKEVAVKNENFFTAIYCVVFQRCHALLAYSQFTEGEPFSSLPTCVPTTNHALHQMMDLPAYWVADPQVVINLNVSWMKYAWRWILERFPEIHDVAVRYGANPAAVDVWRDNHMPSIEHYFNEILTQTDQRLINQFKLVKLVASIKHTPRYQVHRGAFIAAYSKAVGEGHPIASRNVDSIFIQN